MPRLRWMVYMPCVLCRVRSSFEESARGGTSAARCLEESLSLNLRPEHRARYEEVRRRRESEREGETGRQGDRETRKP